MHEGMKFDEEMKGVARSVSKDLAKADVPIILMATICLLALWTLFRR